MKNTKNYLHFDSKGKETFIGVMILILSLFFSLLSSFIHKYTMHGVSIADVFFIMFYGLFYLFLIDEIYRERKWARNAYAVFAVMGMIFHFSFIHLWFQGDPINATIITVAKICEIIAFVYIFRLIFFINFIKNPLRNASIIPSSTSASLAMVKDIDFSLVNVVVELGPGTGCFTEQTLKRCTPNTKIILIEIEQSYVAILQKKFGNRVIIENTSAHLLDEVLRKHGIEKVDVIISGLPFTLPQDIFEKMIASIYEQTKRGATFKFFTYMPPVMKRYYKALPIQKRSFVFRNVPPLWVYGIN